MTAALTHPLTPAMSILEEAGRDAASRFALYRLAADAALDAGEEGAARGLSWLAGEQRAPGCWDNERGLWGWYANDGSFSQPTVSEYRRYPHHLTVEVWLRMPSGEPHEYQRKTGGLKIYPDFAQAVLAAARAASEENAR